MSQIESEGITYDIDKINTDDIIKVLEKIAKEADKHFHTTYKAGKEAEEHLLKRSEELGKPIPIELQVALVYIYRNGVFFTSNRFLKEYKEWL